MGVEGLTAGSVTGVADSPRGSKRWARLIEQTATALCLQEAGTEWDDAPEDWRVDYRRRAGALLVSTEVIDLFIALSGIDELLTDDRYPSMVPSGDGCKVAARALARSALDVEEG